MRVLELFAGTRSIGKAFEKRGHDVFSVEWDKQFKDINLYEDILKVTPEQIISEWGGRGLMLYGHPRTALLIP